jgi:hypothetical protein
LLFDASVPAGFDTYRAYRHVWHARPDSPPVATAKRNPDGTTTVHAIWNGATDVARWIVIGDDGGGHGHGHGRSPWALGAAAWAGLDTTLTMTGAVQQLAVVAEDEDGRVIDRSPLVTVGP